MLNQRQTAQLIEALKRKKSALLAMLERLIEFEQAQPCRLFVVGSVPLCEYWLDSDLDVYLDESEFASAQSAWLDLAQSDEKLDAIVSPAPAFLAQIKRDGVDPSEAKQRLIEFSDEADLIDEFAQRRHDKILRCLDSSGYFIDQLESLKQLIEKQGKKTSTRPGDGSIDSSLLYGQAVSEAAFRFVWVSVMILSRYEMLWSPVGAEAEHWVSADKWNQWVAILVQPQADRSSFIVPHAQQVEDFYRHKHENASNNPPLLPADEVLQKLSFWQQALEDFEEYTRQWIAENWRNQL
jgi:hypothetical protein